MLYTIVRDVFLPTYHQMFHIFPRCITLTWIGEIHRSCQFSLSLHAKAACLRVIHGLTCQLQIQINQFSFVSRFKIWWHLIFFYRQWCVHFMPHPNLLRAPCSLMLSSEGSTLAEMNINKLQSKTQSQIMDIFLFQVVFFLTATKGHWILGFCVQWLYDIAVWKFFYFFLLLQFSSNQKWERLFRARRVLTLCELIPFWLKREEDL